MPTVRLDQFLKLAGVVDTGGQAKVLIQGGEVLVDGVVETRRRKQLSPGAVVAVGGEEFEVAAAVTVPAAPEEDATADTPAAS